MYHMYHRNNKSLRFNNAECGIALRRVAGVRLVTTGISDCVVLQVLSNEYVFVAHLTRQDSENNNLRQFCNRVKDAFLAHESQISSCRVWSTRNPKSMAHAEEILKNISEYLGVLEIDVPEIDIPEIVDPEDRFKIPSENPNNSSFELIVLENRKCEIGNETTARISHTLKTSNIDGKPFDQRGEMVKKLMENDGYVGFAVSIDEFSGYDIDSEVSLLNIDIPSHDPR